MKSFINNTNDEIYEYYEVTCWVNGQELLDSMFS